MTYETSLASRYKRFLSVALEPIALVAAIVAVLFGIASARNVDPILSGVLTVLVGISSAAAGQAWSKRYFEKEGHRTLDTKGKSAVRSLSHLHQMIEAIEERLAAYLPEDEKPEDTQRITLGVEEAIEKCRLMRGTTVNSIEDWNDILPEADVAKQIGLVQTLRDKVESLSSEVERLEEEKHQTKAESQEKLQATREELDKTRKELKRKTRELATGPLRSLTSRAFSEIALPSIGKQLSLVCEECRSRFVPSERDFRDQRPGTIVLCKECRQA